ncbi:hypothetical protein [Halomonas sp. SpR8]|uniref:hypothetical protein n=1 Tax=Halomonas sp. SpR8 TaxID=3050463 RepID=UPI0027E47647|nr:hypothetical protein [Halomonas sp. SpR8]MDQ7728006.1 hypothetical protein [Halomonas sp. SpR8]
MFSELEACNTWECVNSFASWIAAIGTIFVSSLALWLSWRDSLIRVKATFDYGLVPGDDPMVLDTPVYILEFTNVGRRPVTITNYEWKLRRWHLVFKYKRWFSFPHLESNLGDLCSSFPLELHEGRTGHIFHAKSFFETIEEKESFLFAKNPAVALFRMSDVKISLKTTAGKEIDVKIPFRVRRHMVKQYLKQKT